MTATSIPNERCLVLFNKTFLEYLNIFSSYSFFQDDPVPAREPSKSLHGTEEGRKVRTVVPGEASASGTSPTLCRRASEVRPGAAGKKF